MEHINLLGSDDVRSAGSKMQSAAGEMLRVASTIDESLRRHQQYLEEWITRFERAVEKAMKGE